MTPVPTSRGTRASLLLLALALLVAHLFIGHAHNYIVAPDDDRLWLYGSGAALGRQARLDAVSDQIAASLPDASRQFRFEARRAYDANYIAASVVYRVGNVATRWLWGAPNAENYPAFLVRSQAAGFGLMYSVMCLVVLVAAAMLPWRMGLALVLAVALTGGFEALFDLAGDTWHGLPHTMPIVGQPGDLATAFGRNVPGLLINPQTGFSPFGDTPRNHFLLMMLPLFALRWCGRHGAAYTFLLALSFLHQSQTGLLAAVLVTLDATLRPEIFRTRSVQIAGVAIAVVFVWREALDSVMNLGPVVMAVGAALLGLVALAWLRASGRTTIGTGRLASWRTRARRRGDVTADVVGLAVLWALAWIASYVGNLMASPVDSLYFWSQIGGRMLAMLRPAFVLALALWFVGRLLLDVRPQLAFAGAALLLVPGLLLLPRYDANRLDTMAARAARLDAQAGWPPDWSTLGAQSEEVVYYSLAREMDLTR